MWQIYLQLTPADNLYIIMVGCALILAVIGIIIIGKHKYYIFLGMQQINQVISEERKFNFVFMNLVKYSNVFTDTRNNDILMILCN